ncbi:bifunctional 4-hydroxy-2-oxoglutarate aldolase/2-dehydro-3-deoxy-phosphogluconate aldolase [Ornithinicoccus halotolerans]|uniref:bifunctional 4-hydroxy-2-oxoglutarate aldolase/2-dehydro-3-deoxy-phosphogluconate aldolase n=1 Tax=Ornithinicoccus halotolerans TaxID=1748220 RepID=UPI001297DE90|nr:bifunctional 4-hydroxy-2-oxoglutarate aldolase/2-dehydro-3-deoxy-phosphogluconate aldolase [Ornithinicoccus halotolerans]
MTTHPTIPTTGAELMRVSPVIPVVVLHDADAAVPLAQALCRGGIGMIEVTLRTDAGMDAIERIAAEVPDIIVGAGTVLDPAQAWEAARRGAQFLVTPGSPGALTDAAIGTGLAVLAGASTLTEMMTLREKGILAQKFFPAEAAGGSRYLQAVHGPLPGLEFCPTGGVTADNAGDYLALPNVVCVGGSWLTPDDAVAEGDWDRIQQLAAEAAALGG